MPISNPEKRRIWNREYARKRRSNKKNNNICNRCSNQVERDMVYCNECLPKLRIENKKRIQKRKSNDKCIKCGFRDKINTYCCLTCYLKNISNRHFKTFQHWEFLKTLFQNQNGKCPYTGRQLNLGTNTVLDHIVPLGQGGPNTLDNLQWIYAPVNKMKFDLLEAEFLALVNEIYHYQLQKDENVI